jgi:hypothetical protein
MPQLLSGDRKDHPASLYFPTNDRWSMGLLICLSGAHGVAPRSARSTVSAAQTYAPPNSSTISTSSTVPQPTGGRVN